MVQKTAARIAGRGKGPSGAVIGSLISPAPAKEVQELVDHVRYPNLEGDISTQAT